MGRKAVEIVDGKLRCTRCKESKEVEQFSPHQKRYCGRASHCKLCAAETARMRHEKNPEPNRERAARWRRENPARFKANMATHYDEVKAHLRADYWKRPQVWKARKAVNNAVRDGRLERKPCEVCGADKSHGHHWSYEEQHWLDVKWLCRKHHIEEHMRLRRVGG